MIVLFTGGGTAGHILPNVPVIERLAAAGHEVHYAGSGAALERQLLGALPLQYHVLATGKLRRYLSWENLRDVGRVVRGVIQGYALVRHLRPAVVFSKGGFVSVPAVLGAALCGVPVIAHESDLSPGLANRIANRVARIVCTTFPDTHFGKLGDTRIHFTGLPVRKALTDGNGARGRQWLGIEPADAVPILLVMGGSQGSVRINAFVRGALTALAARYFVVHLCGRANLDANVEGHPRYRQFEFLEAPLGDVVAAAHCVISRAGATTLYELLALRKSVLLVPLTLAQSRGDQLENARWAVAHGYCRLLEEADLSLPRATEELAALSADAAGLTDRLERTFATGDATTRIAALIEEVGAAMNKSTR